MVVGLAAALVPGWIFLLFADCLLEGWFYLKKGFAAEVPERRPAWLLLAVPGAVYLLLGLSMRGGTGWIAAVFGLGSGAAALAANRFLGRWWRAALCAASLTALLAARGG
ncbi:MAG: hypothetical protein ACPLRW_04845 [Moorellales bacterium]